MHATANTHSAESTSGFPSVETINLESASSIVLVLNSVRTIVPRWHPVSRRSGPVSGHRKQAVDVAVSVSRASSASLVPVHVADRVVQHDERLIVDLFLSTEARRVRPDGFVLPGPLPGIHPAGRLKRGRPPAPAEPTGLVVHVANVQTVRRARRSILQNASIRYIQLRRSLRGS